MAPEQQLAQIAGLTGSAIGIAEIAAPRQFASMLGIPPDDAVEDVTRLMGVREIAGSLPLVVQANPMLLWSRVAGDALDLFLLWRGWLRPGAKRERVAAAMAFVVGTTALDVAAATLATRAAARTKGGGRKVTASTVQITRAITVDRPRDEVYRFWHQLENLPRFMTNLEEVRTLDDRRSHWRAKAPLGKSVEWEAVIVDDRPNELIAWESTEDADVRNAGIVRFEAAPADRGTEVIVSLEYDPPAGPLGMLAARLTGREPGAQASADLRRFKQVMETGDVVRSYATLEGGRFPWTQRPGQPPETPPSGDGTSIASPGQEAASVTR